MDSLNEVTGLIAPLDGPLNDLESTINLTLSNELSNPLLIVGCELQPLLLTPQNVIDSSSAIFEIITQEDANPLLQPEGQYEMVTMQDEAIEEQPLPAVSDLNVFMCGVCSQVFSSSSQIRSHMITVHKKPARRKFASTSKKKVRSTNQVDYSTQTDNDIVTQSNIVESEDASNLVDQEEHGCPDLIAERLYKCNNVTCGAKFTAEDKLAEHVEMHSDSALRCPNCPFSATKWPALAAHLWRSHAIEHDLYKCSVCKYKTGSRSHLLKHYCAHWEGGGEAACRRCGQLCKTPNDLARHVAQAHPTQSASGGGMKKTCKECGLQLADARCLRRHMKCVHGAVRPYVCGVCSYSAKTRHTLVLHARQHSYDRPFSCDQCAFTSRDHNTMRRHKQRHNGERPYACPHCAYSATQSTSLLGHLTRCHPGAGGAHRCPSCNFMTVSDKLMDVHVRTKHPEGGSNKNNAEEQNRNFSSMFPSSLNANEIVRNYPSGIEDDESSSQCYFDSDHIDTGGITIPAEEPKEGISVRKE